MTPEERAKCINCRIKKQLNLSNFHRDSRTKSGYRGRCKECQQSANKKYADQPHAKKVKLIWRNEHRKEVAGYNKKYRNTHPGMSTKVSKRWRKKYPDRAIAHNAVWKALAKGIITKKPCEVCGVVKVHAHHLDYSKPLNVKWLCHVHHEEAHHGARK